MNKNETNEIRMKESYENNSIIHITLIDGTWRNGVIISISKNYFVFQDRENKFEEAFFLHELKNIEPYITKEESGDENKVSHL